MTWSMLMPAAGPALRAPTAQATVRAEWPAPLRDAVDPRSHLSVDRLRAQPLLANLSDDAALWLASRAAVRRFRRGTVVVEQGQPDDTLFIVLSGTAHAVRRGPQGRKLILEVLSPGDHFGAMGLIDDLPLSASLQAITALELLRVHRNEFAYCLERSPGLLGTLLSALVKRLRSSNRRIAMLALNDVRGCVIRHLLDECEEVDGRRIVRQAINRQTLADMIGASREMVSRVMMDMARNGLIEVQPDGSTRLTGLQAA